MRILLAGAWRFPIYEPSFSSALESEGVSVQPFDWHRYIQGRSGTLQEKWVLPWPSIARLNRDLLAAAVESRPDVVFVWRGTVIHPDTVRRIKDETGAVLVSYNNDDPFAWRQRREFSHHARSWRYYLRSIPSYDVHFVYRPVNVLEMKQAGARETHLLMPYFVPALHNRIRLSPSELRRFGCTAVFAGHFEPDGRAAHITALARAGVDVKVFGASIWNRHLVSVRDSVGNVAPADGLDYARALSGARVGLCFLSRLNRDTYTRRCFEIPACGTVLLSQRTADLQALFREDEEAVFFSSPAELVDKVRWVTSSEPRRRRIAAAGFERVQRDGHSVQGRAREWLAIIAPRVRSPRA